MIEDIAQVANAMNIQPIARYWRNIDIELDGV
jgi:hypothetical protein